MTSLPNVDAIISPKYVQIDTPYRIEPEFLRPFEKGRKAVTLIFAENRRVIHITLESIRDSDLMVLEQAVLPAVQCCKTYVQI